MAITSHSYCRRTRRRPIARFDGDSLRTGRAAANRHFLSRGSVHHRFDFRGKMSVTYNSRSATKRQHLCFALIFTAVALIFRSSLQTLFMFSLKRENCSHLFLIPVITISLVYLKRRSIFYNRPFDRRRGILLLLVGCVVFVLSRGLAPQLSEYDVVSLATFGMVLTWLGAFILSYGFRSFQEALFPLLFLFWMVPIPEPLLERAIFLLQEGSAGVAEVLFHWSGTPAFRQQFLFTLPGLTIEVAQECSGIRSSLALMITGLVASYLFLRAKWKRTLVVTCILPLVVIKNGIRIVTLSLLSIYVNPNFMKGPLHRDGGVLFFALAALLLFPLVRWLSQSDEITPDPGRGPSLTETEFHG
jgi:exosortase